MQGVPHLYTQGTGPSLVDPGKSDLPEFVGVSSALRRLVMQAEMAAPHLNIACLEGESGTGKHLLARVIHSRSGLPSQSFRRRDAREWLAAGADLSNYSGTLYLDRVDLLPGAAQHQFLSVLKALQENSGPRVLLLTSSHSALRLLAGQGILLPDLAFRLTAVRFSIPPLRQHREDIAPITQALIDRICRRYQQPPSTLAPGTLPRLLQHSWPGNVRELASVLESAILESVNGIIRLTDFSVQAPPEAQLAAPQGQSNEDLTLDAVIRRHIQHVLDMNRGNKLRAARQLGISRSTLYRILGGDSSLPE